MDALLSNRNLLAAALYIIIVSSINLVQCQDYNRISKRIQRQSQYGGSGSGDYVFPDYAPTTKYYRSSRHDTSDSNEVNIVENNCIHATILLNTNTFTYLTYTWYE